MIQRISGGLTPLVATLDKDKYYTFASINNIVLKSNARYDIKFILALINSKLINWYYATNFSNKSGLTVNISKTFLEKLPIINIDFSKKNINYYDVIELVENILKLNKELKSISLNSDKWNDIKKEIEKIDNEIDQKVYELYGLTKEEIKIVEGN